MHTEFNENLRKPFSSIVRSEEKWHWCSELMRREDLNPRREQMMQNDMMRWDVDMWSFWKGEFILSGTQAGSKPHCPDYMYDGILEKNSTLVTVSGRRVIELALSTYINFELGKISPVNTVPSSTWLADETFEEPQHGSLGRRSAALVEVSQCAKKRPTWAVKPVCCARQSSLSLRIRAVYDTRRDRQRGGIGSSFEPAKALVRGLPLPRPPSFQVNYQL